MGRIDMTLAEAAEVLGLSPITLRVQVRNGRLSAYKDGRDWRVGWPAIESYRAGSLGRPGRRPSAVS